MVYRMPRVCVITFDVRGSRTVKDRAALQASIRTLLNELNSKFNDTIVANFTLTLGDEFQGVLKSPSPFLRVVKLVRECLPVKVYCGVGMGEVLTPLSRMPGEMDGPAFHRSRQALEEAKRRRIELVVRSGEEIVDSLVNPLSLLILHVMSGWTKRQREVISLIESGEHRTLSEIARKLSVSKQSVSKIVRSSGWRIVNDAMRGLELYLDSWWRKGFKEEA